MKELNIYFKIFGLAVDEKDNPDWGGMKIDLGKAKPGVQYSDIQNKGLSAPDWKKQVLQLLPFESAGIKEKDIELITPEEYNRDYNDNDEEEWTNGRTESVPALWRKSRI